jgi:hypothetical protein
MTVSLSCSRPGATANTCHSPAPTHPLPLPLPPVLNAPLWLAYGLVQADPAPAMQAPLVCGLLLLFMMAGGFLQLVRMGVGGGGGWGGWGMGGLGGEGLTLTEEQLSGLMQQHEPHLQFLPGPLTNTHA